MPRETQTYLLQGNALGATITLPRQQDPFRLLAVACAFIGGSGVSSSVIELRASYGNVAPFIRISTGEIGPTLSGGACWFIGGGFQQIAYAAGATLNFCQPLPDIIFEPNTVVQLVWGNPNLDETIANPTFVLQRL